MLWEGFFFFISIKKNQSGQKSTKSEVSLEVHQTVGQEQLKLSELQGNGFVQNIYEIFFICK